MRQVHDRMTSFATEISVRTLSCHALYHIFIILIKSKIHQSAVSLHILKHLLGKKKHLAPIQWLKWNVNICDLFLKGTDIISLWKRKEVLLFLKGGFVFVYYAMCTGKSKFVFVVLPTYYYNK